MQYRTERTTFRAPPTKLGAVVYHTQIGSPLSEKGIRVFGNGPAYEAMLEAVAESRK